MLGSPPRKDIDMVNVGNVMQDCMLENVTEEELLHFISSFSEKGYSGGNMHLIDSVEELQNLSTFFKDHEKVYEMGGSGPNSIKTLAALGLTTAQVGLVGNDAMGNMYREAVTAKGIGNYIGQREGTTAQSLILVTPSDRTMFTYLGMCRNYQKTDIPEALIKRAKYLLLTGYQWDTENQKEAMRYVFELAKEYQTKIVFTLASKYSTETNREAFQDIVTHHADIVFGNEPEVMALFKKDVDASLDEFAERIQLAVVTCGEKGSYIQVGKKHNIGKERLRIPVTPLQGKIDRTGAGDMYLGGFMYGLIKGLPLEVCGMMASESAKLVLKEQGARLPKYDALDISAKKFRDLLMNKFGPAKLDFTLQEKNG